MDEKKAYTTIGVALIVVDLVLTFGATILGFALYFLGRVDQAIFFMLVAIYFGRGQEARIRAEAARKARKN